MKSEFIECSSASNPCKLSFDDNAIKTLSDVRQLVCRFFCKIDINIGCE